MPKRSIGVLTSGGDAQGMNAAVRAVVRMGIHLGADVYGILDGYQGMVDNNIKQLGWHDVGGILQEGGTFIGTARCASFTTKEGRKQAARNLLKRKINRLVIIGGDGSLTGAQVLSNEWPQLVQEIIAEEGLNEEEATELSYLVVVGLVGSIDNDMCGTDQTIGADTALNHIIRAIDAIMSTAASHQREFIVEVMGRNCGWLALMGAIASASDWVIIPEHPPSGDWRSKLVEAIRKGKEMGKKSSIVVLAEGARDSEGKPISSNDVKAALDEGGFDSRITILGHVQRGGSPSAWDRNMTSIQGVQAAQLAVLGEKDAKPSLVGIIHNRVTVTPLEVCLKEIRCINVAIKNHEYDVAMQLRGNIFKEAYYIAKTLTGVNKTLVTTGKSLKIGVLHVGACSPGMNAAVRAFVRLGLHKGHEMFGIMNGVDGLLNGELNEMKWISVNGWAKEGGAKLGARRAKVEAISCAAIVEALKKHNLEALVMIGGWDGYELMLKLYKEFDLHSHLYKRIPIVLIPASISNNLPCSALSIGADTALNNIIDAVDKIKQSAVSSNRIFVVEVMGSNGFLAVMSALATGADKVYIPEERITLNSLQTDINEMMEGFNQHTQSCLVINNESASKVFTTETLAKLFEDQSNGKYIVRTAVLGHLQQGGVPSAWDRIFATTTSAKALEFIEGPGIEKAQSACIGLVEGAFRWTLFEEMEEEMDLKHRRPKHQWWESNKWILSALSHKTVVEQQQ